MGAREAQKAGGRGPVPLASREGSPAGLGVGACLGPAEGACPYLRTVRSGKRHGGKRSIWAPHDSCETAYGKLALGVQGRPALSAPGGPPRDDGGPERTARPRSSHPSAFLTAPCLGLPPCEMSIA